MKFSRGEDFGNHRAQDHIRRNHAQILQESGGTLGVDQHQIVQIRLAHVIEMKPTISR